MALEISAEPRDASAGRWEPVALPSLAAWGGQRVGGGRTGAVGCPHRVAPESSGHSPASQPVSTKGPVGGPQAQDHVHWCATGRTAGRERCRGEALRRRKIDGLCLHDQQAEGVGRDGTTGMEKAEVADFHEARGQDVLEEPADKLKGVEGGGA